MLLESLELNNWQSYKGDKNKFDFNGPASTRNSAIILGRNAKGKSAFFEALRFLLYGKDVVVDRDSTRKTIRPLVAKNKGSKPLMCWEAWRDGALSFGVKGDVKIDGKTYTIKRSYSSTKKKPSEFDLKGEFYILEKSKKKKEANPEAFVNRLLPEGITRFFTIDGELLVEYRRIFRHERAGIADDIETILRLKALDSASYETASVKRTVVSQKRKIERKNATSAAITAELQDLDDDIDEVTEKIDIVTGQISELEEEVDILFKWLQGQGNQQAHLDKLEEIDDLTDETKNEIQKKKDKRAKQLNNAWKQVLAEKVSSAIETQEEILKRQQENKDDVAHLNGQIIAKKNLLANVPCTYCQQTRQIPTAEMVKISDEIVELTREMYAINDLSETPDPFPIMDRIRAMTAMKTDLSYSDTNQLSKDIASLDIKLISLEKDREVTLDDLGEAALKEGREKRAEHREKTTDLGNAREMLKLHLSNEEHLTNTRTIKQGKTKSSAGSKSLHSLENKIGIADLLIELCSEAKDPFRNSTRISVSKLAEKTYLKLIDEDHDRLEFDSQFRVKVFYADGGEVILTPGQMGLATYCILEALSTVSDIDFPLIVDSPGQGIDMEYMEEIFTHVLGASDRQIIVIPTTSEIDDENMVDNFGSSVASIYELQRPKGSRETEIVTIHRRKK